LNKKTSKRARLRINFRLQCLKSDCPTTCFSLPYYYCKSFYLSFHIASLATDILATLILFQEISARGKFNFIVKYISCIHWQGKNLQ